MERKLKSLVQKCPFPGLACRMQGLQGAIPHSQTLNGSSGGLRRGNRAGKDPFTLWHIVQSRTASFNILWVHQSPRNLVKMKFLIQ